jgi:hypothetical protein
MISVAVHNLEGGQGKRGVNALQAVGDFFEQPTVGGSLFESEVKVIGVRGEETGVRPQQGRSHHLVSEDSIQVGLSIKNALSQSDNKPVQGRRCFSLEDEALHEVRKRSLHFLEGGLDGQELKTTSKGPTLWLMRTGSTWTAGDEPSPALKGPRRSGPFKDAFRNRMVFVYGTMGTAEENAWAFDKARFDAECFQYQGNGSVDIVSDRDFDPARDSDRNVILYGNAATNLAWKALLGDSPVQVTRGFVAAAGKKVEGKDLACLFLRPRPGSETASVGVVSGTGLLGMRLTNTRSYLYAGYALPDLVVYNSDVARSEGRGLKLAGFFGNDWSFDTGEFLWGEPAPLPVKK